MIVKRKELSFWERLYLPAIAGGFKVTAKHFVNTLFRGHTAACEVDQDLTHELRRDPEEVGAIGKCNRALAE